MTSSSEGPLMVSVSGVRGIVGKTMTPEVAARFAGAVGTWLVRRAKAGRELDAPVVLVSWDGRRGGEALYNAAKAGLLATGCSTIGCGIAMTPSLAVGVDARKAAAGIQITASHNPQEWNGLKVLWRDRDGTGRSNGMNVGVACAPPAALAAEIIDLFKRSSIDWDMPGSLPRCLSVPRDEDAADRCGDDHALAAWASVGYAYRGLSEATGQRWFRAVLDHCNASGQLGGPALLRLMRCAMRTEGDWNESIGSLPPTGLFPHIPEPTEANLTQLAAEVKKHKADVGFAQDPDADRLAIIDENGKYIGEEYTLVLAALALAEFGVLKQGSQIAVNLSTSRMIEDVAAKYGATVVRTAVGEANVVEAMKRIGPEVCVLGGEGNGGVIWPWVTYVRDSLSGMALVLALMAKTGKTVSQLVSGVPSYAIVKRKVDLKDRSEAVRAAEAVKGCFKSAGGVRIDTQDGVRVDVDDSTYGKAWIHVRASNTEPIMRLIAEAPTKVQAEKMLDEAAKAIG